MTVTLPKVEYNSRAVALGGALVLAVLIFLLIPITQSSDDQSDVVVFREVSLVQPPVPVAPPNAVELPPPEEEPPRPRFKKQLSALNLNPLELSLDPGINDALASGISNGGFETEMDAIEDIQKMFTFDDLSKAPNIINRPRVQFPQELIQRSVLEGRVVVLIEINEKGRARIIEIISSTHPQLVKTAKEVIRQAQFTKPVVNGIAQKVRGEWPLVLRAPQ